MLTWNRWRVFSMANARREINSKKKNLASFYRVTSRGGLQDKCSIRVRSKKWTSSPSWIVSADTRNTKDDALFLCLLEPGCDMRLICMYVYAVPRSSLTQFLDKSFYTYLFLINENFLRRARRWRQSFGAYGKERSVPAINPRRGIALPFDREQTTSPPVKDAA